MSFNRAKAAVCGSLATLCLSVGIAGQGAAGNPVAAPAAATAKFLSVKQIDNEGLRKALTPAGKPLLVNFWATWCDPCREEFPDLVKLDAEYRGKIDFITISLDELSEINRDVPKFLAEMKAEMPAYLLKAQDDDAAIAIVSKDFTGALPFTILYDPAGKQAYFRQGKVKLDVLRTELDKLVVPAAKPSGQVAIMDFVKIKDGRRDEALFYYENNWKIYRDAAIKKGFIKSYELVEGDAVANSQFDLVLITRFANEEQFKNTETNFQPIIKQLRPTGPVLKNDLKPDDFRQNVFARVVRTQLPSIITN